MNPDKVDVVKFPGVFDVPWTHATLNPGDCIFIPGGTVHCLCLYAYVQVDTALIRQRFPLSFLCGHLAAAAACADRLCDFAIPV